MPQNNFDLKDIQNSFKDLMLDDPQALETPHDMLSTAFVNDDIALPNRLKIYRNNIIGSLTDIMKATFPTIEKLVGNDFFEGCARAFILSHPPEHGCLTWYGTGFDLFLQDFEPARSLPYLPDIAALEIALNASYYAKDDMVLSGDALGKIPPDDLPDTVLKLRDNVRLIQSSHPIDKIRDFCLSEDQSTPPDMNSGATFLMVHRPELSTEIIILDADEFYMLTHFQEGQTLGASVQNTLGQYPEFNFHAFLEKFMSLETFLSFKTNS